MAWERDRDPKVGLFDRQSSPFFGRLRQTSEPWKLVDVIDAGVAIYFMLAATFAAVVGAIEATAPGSFISSGGAEITWQRLAYFNDVTVTMLCYGDIVPVTPSTQSISAMEASIGTLYIAILSGRFVSLFQRGERQDFQKSAVPWRVS